MRRALSFLIAFSWLLNGCHSWQTQEVAPAGYIQSQHPGKIRLTLQDATQLTLRSPAVVGDSINGWVPGKGGNADSLRLRTVAAGEVQSFEVQQTDVVASIFLGLGIAAGAFLVFLGGLVIACAATGCYD